MKTKVVYEVFTQRNTEWESEVFKRIEEGGFEIFQVVPVYSLDHNHSQAGISHSMSCVIKYYCKKIVEINQ